MSEIDTRFTESSEFVTSLHCFTLQARLTLGQVSQKSLGLCSLVSDTFTFRILLEQLVTTEGYEGYCEQVERPGYKGVKGVWEILVVGP